MQCACPRPPPYSLKLLVQYVGRELERGRGGGRERSERGHYARSTLRTQGRTDHWRRTRRHGQAARRLGEIGREGGERGRREERRERSLPNDNTPRTQDRIERHWSRTRRRGSSDGPAIEREMGRGRKERDRKEKSERERSSLPNDSTPRTQGLTEHHWLRTQRHGQRWPSGSPAPFSCEDGWVPAVG